MARGGGVLPAGIELGYAQITSSPSGITGVGAANRVDVAGLTVTITVGARPIRLIAHAPLCSNSILGSGGSVGIYESNTQITQASFTQAIAGQNQLCRAELRLAPSAGAHTYKVTAWAATSGTFTLAAGATFPAFLHVVEC